MSQSERPAVIICVDDEPMVTESLRMLLASELNGLHVIETARSGEEALEILDEMERDGIDLHVVISDYIMPGMTGDELLARVHARRPAAKTIMLTGQSRLEGVTRAINEAALFRFLEKPWHNQDLVLTVRAAVTAYRQERELERQNALLRELNEQLEAKVAERTRELEEKNRELERLSITDRLTGLFNRGRLDQVLREERLRSIRSGRSFGLILMDVDHFKSINDGYGHQIGDQVLVTLAGLLSRGLRATDTAGRWGGEEFLVICPETDRDGTTLLAECLRHVIAQHDFPEIGRCTASFGVASYREDESIDATIARADAALYRAKHGGRNRVVTAS